MSHVEAGTGSEHSEHVSDPHEKIGQIVMYIIAGTLIVCTLGVVLLKGVDAMPYDWIGVIGAAIFTVAALAMTRIPSGH